MLGWLADIIAPTSAIPTTSTILSPDVRAAALGYAPGSTHAKRGVLNPAVNAHPKCRVHWRVGM